METVVKWKKTKVQGITTLVALNRFSLYPPKEGLATIFNIYLLIDTKTNLDYYVDRDDADKKINKILAKEATPLRTKIRKSK